MENKPQNVFEKLDKQGEQIDDISSKLEGVSINDLYALAKRTWDYGDFVTAQKYYNHISFLRPTDWEAPLMASLCNFSGVQDVRNIEASLPSRVKLFYSTIEYLLKIDLDEEKKQEELKKCKDIIKTKLIRDKDVYYDNIEIFDRLCKNYIEELQDMYINFYEKIKDISNSVIDELKRDTLDCFFELVEKTCYITSSVDKIKFNSYAKLTTKAYNIDLEKLFSSKKEVKVPLKESSKEEKNEIKLKGTLYYEYDDKVIAQRIFRKRLIYGIIFIVVSILGIISSIDLYLWVPIIFIPSLIYGVLLIIRTISQKEIINCYSILCPKPKRARLSSNGDVVIESRINFLYVFIWSLIMIQIVICAPLTVLYLIKEGNLIFKVFFTIVTIILWLLSSLQKEHLGNLSNLEGKYKYLYKGNYYPLNNL